MKSCLKCFKKRMAMVFVLCLSLFSLSGCLGMESEESSPASLTEAEAVVCAQVQMGVDFSMSSNVRLIHAESQILSHEVTYERVLYFDTEEEAKAAVERGELGEADIYVCSTETTEKKLERLNAFIADDKLESHLETAYGITSPVQPRDLIEHGEDFCQFFKDREYVDISTYEYIVY